MAQTCIKQEKILNLLKDIPPNKLKELTGFVEYLKAKGSRKTVKIKAGERINLPTFHLGRLTADALDRGRLYGENLDRKLA